MSEIIRTQICLTLEQHQKLKRWSEETNKTMASLICEAVDRYLAKEQLPDRFPADDPLFDLVGIVQSGPIDISENHDIYLYRGSHYWIDK